MTIAQEIRHETLLQLYGSGSIPISVTHIQRSAKRAGFAYAAADIETALHFLVGQKLAEEVADPGTGEKRWRITSTGMIHHEQNS